MTDVIRNGVFGVENVLDIGEGEPLFGNFEYKARRMKAVSDMPYFVSGHLAHVFSDDTPLDV